jgi:hypothetical protein
VTTMLDAEEILASIGYGAAEIAALHAEKVV